MARIDQIVFSHKEVAAALIKEQDIHEGLWGVYIEFGIGAANIGAPGDEANVVPAAIVPVQRMGIQRFEEPNSLTVDAAEVNPAPESSEGPNDTE